MFYIKLFLKSFWDTIKVIWEPSSKLELLQSLTIYAFIALGLIFSNQSILATIFIINLINPYLSYKYNNGYKNIWILITGFIISIVTLIATIILIINSEL